MVRYVSKRAPFIYQREPVPEPVEPAEPPPPKPLDFEKLPENLKFVVWMIDQCPHHMARRRDACATMREFHTLVKRGWIEDWGWEGDDPYYFLTSEGIDALERHYVSMEQVEQEVGKDESAVQSQRPGSH